MCGIAGIWNKNGKIVNEKQIGSMVEILNHRGPDAKGVWINENIAFGHSRLKVLDLSDNANQPFTDGEDYLIFNGEIFNYVSLKKKMSERYQFRTKSDTEVLFRALQYWGMDVFKYIQGQFSFAFYSKKNNKLIIARDHFGICPLYTLETDTQLIFSSEIKPILFIEKQQLNKCGVVDYFGYRYNIQNGETLFGDIKRFNPGTFWEIDLTSKKSFKKKFWRLEFKEEKIGDLEFQKTFNMIFDNEISRQSFADVPVGLYLSGGIDSSALFHGFSKQNTEIQSYTLKFSNEDEDFKRVHSMKPQKNFKKTFLGFQPNLVIEKIRSVISSLEEPFGDLIVVANYLLAMEASKDLKVVLSGEGGDEAFLGYDHQRTFLQLSKFSKSKTLKKIGEILFNLSPIMALNKLNSYPGSFGFAEKRKMGQVFNSINDPSSAYLGLVTLFRDDELDLLFSHDFKSSSPITPDYQPIKDIFQEETCVGNAIMRSEIEQLTLIINLIKQDRFAMNFSMEGRVPFVSKPLLEFVASISKNQIYSKINKEVLIRYSNIKPIKKKAFSVFSDPQYFYTITYLLDTYVTREKVCEYGGFSWNYIEKMKAELRSGGILIVKKIMCIIVFMIWWDVFKHYLKD